MFCCNNTFLKAGPWFLLTSFFKFNIMISECEYTLAWLFLLRSLSPSNPKCRKANDALLRNPFAKISFCTLVICKKLIFCSILQPHMFKMLQLPHFLTFLQKIFSGVSMNLVRCYTEKFIKFDTKIKCTETFVWTCSLHFCIYFHFGGLYWKKFYYNFFF